MVYEIQKSDSDFVSATHGINFKKFQDEVWNEAGITTLFHGVRTHDDETNIHLVFEEEPSSGELIILDALIAAHTGKAAPLSALDVAKAEAKETIDQIAGEARARYVTIAPGQTSVYIAKRDEAQAHKDAGYPVDLTNYKFIEAEVNAQSYSTAQEASDALLAIAASWTAIAASIEEVRLTYKNQISSASTTASIAALRNKAIALLNNI